MSTQSILAFFNNILKVFPFASTLRMAVIYPLLNWIAPRPKKQIDANVKEYVVAGYFRATTGLGRSAELLAKSLEEEGKKVYRLDIAHFFIKEKFLLPFQQQEIPLNIPMILHANPPYIGYIYLRLGYKFIKFRNIVGYWAWELPDVPKNWLSGFKLVNQVWSASTFCQTAFQKHIESKVELVPHPVKKYPGPFKLRKHFNIPENVFMILYVFSIGSGIKRKNPEAAIAAFRHAFGNNSSVLLVLKITAAYIDMQNTQYLLDLVKTYDNVRIIHEDMTYEETISLIQACNVYLSLHRSEGFGLTIAEAIAQEKPVIATGWSGNLDFMQGNKKCYPVKYKLIPSGFKDYNDKEMCWAEADIEDASQALKQIFTSID